MQELAWSFYIGLTIVSNIIHETCGVLVSVLQPIYLPSPTKRSMKNVADGFWQRWNMPNCIGAVDGKHIMIQAPAHSGSEYSKYKKHFR